MYPGEHGYGDEWFVDSANGASGNDGKSWEGAVNTIAAAVALASAGDTVYVRGSFNEAVEVAVAGLRLIGCGTTSNQALWTAPDTTAPCLTITAVADCEIRNIRFRPAVANAAIEMTGACHQTHIIDCRFQGKAGAYYAIYTDGAQANVKIENCEFFYLNTATYGAAILGHTYTSSEPTGWMIENCKFHSNLRHIECRMRQSIIQNCVFSGKGLLAAGTMGASTKNIDISGATGGCNLVTKNLLGGDYSNTGGYTAGTDDNWTGNYADDVSETEVDASGLTITIPAA